MIVSLAAMNETPHMQQDDLRDGLTGSSLAVDIFSRRLVQSCVTSFIDAKVDSDDDLRADMLCNVRGTHKVLDDIETELNNCTRFDIAVAFITYGGLIQLLGTLEDLKKKRIDNKPVHGRVLTTDYLTFSEPAAIRRLMSLDNIETRIYGTRDGAADGFHTKGWLFEREDVCRFIIGSSNLTEKALSVSHEWNTRLVCRESGAFAKKIRHEFEELWNHPQSRPARDVIDAYQIAWDQRVRERPPVIRPAVQALPEPNVMQQRFLEKLDQCLAEGRKRALLISATGTGKTYAAAFAVRRMAPSRVLFLVHREQIARQAMASFQRVLGGPDEDFGLLGGGVNQADRKYVFATVQTVMLHMNKRPELSRESFEVIIVDEVHRAGADGYQSVMAHFEPRFWLGMTGSPYRTDGVDIYELFDHNIVYEIRLQTALEHDLLCPFHYFGISDLSVLQNDLQAKNLSRQQFALLDGDEAARRVLEKSRYYGWSGPRVKALVFCSDVQRAEEMAAALNRQKARALAIAGDSSVSARMDAIRRLTQDAGADCLDYLVTVDIFNEGVDIPEVNQVILMRPTKSAIIFIQQLGRGLRKHPGKDFTVVLDFIANCDNNYLIPVALTGDRTYSRENMRRAVEKTRISGISSIHFDKIARQQIYNAIDRARIGRMNQLKEWYRFLKQKLGRIPSLLDFEEHGEADAVLYLDKPTGWSYHRFLQRADPENYDVVLTPDADRRIAWIGRKLGTGLRPSEAMVLEAILDRERRGDPAGWQEHLRDVLKERLKKECEFACTEHHLNSVAAMLTNRFELTDQAREATAGMTFIEDRGDNFWAPDPGFMRTLREDAAFMPMIQELLTFILRRWRKVYAKHAKDSLLCLGSVYTYEDVCRMLDWNRLIPAQNIGGYFYDDTTHTLPIFINYAKPDGAIAYADRFLSRDEIVCLSKTNRKTTSKDAQRMTRQPGYKDTRVHLFVRRNKGKNAVLSFYYLGEVDPASGATKAKIEGSDAPVFQITWRLSQPVEPGLYEYLTGGDSTGCGSDD